MKKKICILLFMLIVLSTAICISNCYAADDVLGKLGGMEGNRIIYNKNIEL